MKTTSESRLRAEFAAIPIPVFAWEVRDDDLVLVDFNEAAAILTEGRVADIVGQGARALYRDQPAVLEMLFAALESPQPLQREIEYTLVTTGDQRLLNVTFARAAPDLVVVATEDLTARRKAEDALRESERRYRTLVEGAPDGIVVHRDGTIVYVNDAFTRMMRGSDSGGMVGTRVLEWVHPDDRALVKGRIATINQGGSAPILGERLMRSDGSVLYAEIVGIPTTYDGQPAVQAIVRDVSDRRRAEALFFALSDQGTTGVSVIQDGRFVYANPRCADLFGYAVGELIGMSADTLVAESSREHVQRMQRGRLEHGTGSVHYTFTALKKDGARAEIEVYGTVIDLDGRPALVGTLLDATEREQMAMQLRQAQKMEAVGQLAGGVAHDFNNILTAINAYSDFLLQELDEDSPLRRDVLEIRSAGVRAAELTRQLLAFSRKQSLEPRLVDVNVVLENMGRLLGRLIGASIHLTVDLGPNVPVVWADPGQLEQVLMNLVVNARDAMPGGGSLDLSTRFTTFSAHDTRAHPGLSPGRYVQIRVRDTGGGIAPEVAGRIFEPFFTTKPAGKGTGLGLSVVYGIVKQSGGYIMLETEVGKGSTFSVLLPPAQNEKQRGSTGSS